MKRYFISLYSALTSILAVYSALRLVLELTNGGPAVLEWLFATIAFGAPATLFAAVFIRPRARTSENLWPLQIAVILGCAGLALLLPGSILLLIVALVVSLGGTLAYVYWYSRFGRTRSTAIEVGAVLPDVAFEDLDGRAFSTADLRGRPAALMFYRGNWCPLCMAQIGEVAARYRELSEMGVEVVLVSGQDEDHTRDLAERHGVDFRYLRDPDLAGSNALGLVSRDGTPFGMIGYDADTVLPTVLVLDRDGKILLSDQTDNYRVRPTPDTIIQALRSAA